MSTAQCTSGGQVEASTTSAVTSELRNRRAAPSRTRVVAISSLGASLARSASKLTCFVSTRRNGSRSSGSNWPERSAAPKATELPAGEKPPSSISERNEASVTIRFQNCDSRARARSRPPSARPEASSTALTLPALAPLMASKAQTGSSNSRSSTPQVKAANEPPPCKASDNLCGGQLCGGEALASRRAGLAGNGGGAARWVITLADLTSATGGASGACAAGFSGSLAL